MWMEEADAYVNVNSEVKSSLSPYPKNVFQKAEEVGGGFAPECYADLVDDNTDEMEEP